MLKHRSAILLVTLVLLLFAVPAVSFVPRHQSAASHIVITVFFAVTLAAAVLAVSSGWKSLATALLLATSVVVLQASAPFLESDKSLIAEYTLSLAFLGFTIAAVLRSIFRCQRVTFNTICAALSVYLLLGVFWAIAYSLLDVSEPGQSFHFALDKEGTDQPMRFGDERSILPLYFSFVTLTTLGYGDILPNSPSARMLTTFEAVLGQLYLAVLVARLVALHIVDSRRRSGNGTERAS